MILREVLGGVCANVPGYGQIENFNFGDMKVEKVMINGKGYYHYRNCKNIKDLCARCCFMKKSKNGATRCELPFKCKANGYYIFYNEKPIEIGDSEFVIDVPPPPEPGEKGQEAEGKAAAQQQLTERGEEEIEAARKEQGEADKEQEEKAAAQQQLTERSEKETVEDGKAKKTGSIGKRSYYAFPNGVEAEDICRYLSFNLGNVVKYACRAGRKDAKKKIDDLMKA